MIQKSGIYKIQHTSGKCYVGSTKSFKARWHEHVRQLRKGRHHSIKLQNSWNKYGESAFSFVVLEEVLDCTNLIIREQHWIDALGSHAHGFNVRPKAGNNFGSKHSEDANRAKSQRQMGRFVSEETREKMRIASTGRKHSAEALKKISLAGKNRPVSKETIEKLRLVNTGRKMPVESVLRGAEKRRGKPMPPHVRAAVAAANVGRKQTPEEIEKRASKLRGKKKTDEMNARQSAARKGIPVSEEQKRKISATLKGRGPSPEAIAKAADLSRGKKRPQHVIDAIKAKLKITFALKKAATFEVNT